MGERWWNVNEDGEAYDNHPTEAAALLVQAEFPADVVVKAATAEEAERRAFAKPSVPLDVVQAMSTFAAEWWEMLYDPDQVHDRCFTFSEAFVEHLADADTEVRGEIVSGFKTDEPNGFLIWGGHAAVRIDGDIVIDWSARQFDPEAPVPRVVTLAEWRESWADLGTITGKEPADA